MSRHFSFRLCSALVALLCAILCADSNALGWTEARPAGLVTEVVVRPDGGAEVTLRIRWRVLAGRLRQFELADLPADLALIEASASTRADVSIPLRANVIAPGRMEVSFGEQGGVRRGTVDVVVRYTTSLRATGAIRRAGPDAVLELSTVPWERGLEAAELRISVPASVRRAQWIDGETPGVSAQTTTELSRDVVHALRRHLPPHTRWTARVAVDPHAFPWLTSRAASGPRPVRLERVDHRRELLAGLGLASLFLLVGVALSRRAGPAALPLRGRARWLPGLLLVAGGVLQPLGLGGVAGALPVGTLLIVCAVALRLPARPHASLAGDALRGRWIESRAIAALDLRPSRAPLALALATALSAAAATRWAQTHASLPMGLAALDLSLLTLAIIALRARHEAHDAGALLPIGRDLARALAAAPSVRVAWQLRGPSGALGALRIRVVPRAGWRFVRGMTRIELGCAWRRGALRWKAEPYAALRAAAESDAERAFARLADEFPTGAVLRSTEGVALLIPLAEVDVIRLARALVSSLDALVVRCTEAQPRPQNARVNETSSAVATLA